MRISAPEALTPREALEDGYSAIHPKTDIDGAVRHAVTRLWVAVALQYWCTRPSVSFITSKYDARLTDICRLTGDDTAEGFMQEKTRLFV